MVAFPLCPLDTFGVSLVEFKITKTKRNKMKFLKELGLINILLLVVTGFVIGWKL